MRLPPRAEIQDLLLRLLDKALQAQEPVARGHVVRVRVANPKASPQELIDRLEKQYLAAVSAMGGAAGAAAVAPGVGIAALPINVAEVGTFVEATTLFVLAVAEVHGIRVDDVERRRTLVLAIIVGGRGSQIVSRMAGRAGQHWARQVIRAIPISTIRAINKALGRHFVTKYGTKQGILVLGRELPIGIGAAIGAAGNAGLGYVSVRAARRAFGSPNQPPEDLPASATVAA